MIDIAILCAVGQEFAVLKDKIQVIEHDFLYAHEYVIGTYQQQKIIIMKSGIGLIPAASCTAMLIVKFDPKVMLFSGIAGALDPDLQLGEVVIVQSTFQAEAITHLKFAGTPWEIATIDYSADPFLLDSSEKMGMSEAYMTKLGIAVSSDLFPAPPDFLQLFKEKQAIAIDMETAAFYHVSHKYSKPCLAMRSISNPVRSADHEEIGEDAVKISANNAADCTFRLIDHL